MIESRGLGIDSRSLRTSGEAVGLFFELDGEVDGGGVLEAKAAGRAGDQVDYVVRLRPDVLHLKAHGLFGFW